MTRPRRLGAILFLVLVPLGAHAQDLPKPGEKWAEAAAPGLLVLGQAPPRRVEEVARDLSLVRAAVLSIAGAPDHVAPYPTTVIVLGNDATLASYARASDSSTQARELLTALDRQGRILALSLESLDAGLPAARATLAADLIDQLVIAPPWLRTGLADLMGRMAPEGRAGDPPRLVERVSSTAAVAAWPAPAALRAARPGEYAETAIGLLRHLANPRSERSSQLRRYLTLLRGGAPADAAFEECFFASFEAVYGEVAQVAARGGAPAIELEPPATALDPAHDPGYERALLALGDLLTRAVPENTVAAEMLYRAVLERRPSDAAALRGVAIVRDLDDRPQDAAELWERSLAADAGDRVTLLLDGWSRLDGFRRSAGTRRGWEDPLPDPVAAARELFVRALAPPGDASPHALHGWAATYLFAREPYEPAVAALERAAKLLPGDDEIAADLVLLHAHAGNQDLAWELRRDRLLGRAPPELDAMVEKLLAEEALHQANRLLLVEQKPDPAIALVRGAVAEVRNPATQAEIEGVLAQMEQVATKLRSDAVYERFLADYQEAQRLAGQRRFDEARKLIEPYAVETMDPVVRDPARDVLRQLDQVDR